MGKYVRVARVGSGGMGEVWKAWDTELNRWVALKFLVGGDVDEVARFRREAQTAAKLSHPNICAVYEVIEFGGRPVIVTQYVDGPTLATFRRDDRRLLVELVRDTAFAIHYAHQQGILHRDLKPSNIMVERNREGRTSRTRRYHRSRSPSGLRVYVMDFGLAKQLGPGATVSQSGTLVGTVAYMPPEQARGKTSELGPAADVYALGATLYDLLSGHPPFRGTSSFEVLRKVVEEEPASIRRKGVDGDLETIVLKAMEKDPAQRYVSAEAFGEDLWLYLEGEPIAARPPSIVYRSRKFLYRHRTLVAGMLAAVLLAGGAVGTWGWMRVEEEREETDRERRMREEAKAEAERYRRVQELLRLVDAKIQETRVFFYVPALDVRRRLDALERELLALHALLDENPPYRGHSEVWAVLGRGWYLAGDAARAEECLLRAEKLGSSDGRVAYVLGRLYLERSMAATQAELGRAADELRKESQESSRKAAEYLERASVGREATELDEDVAKGYGLFVRGRRDTLLEFCEKALARHGQELGTEEFWNLQGMAWYSRSLPRAVDCYTRALERRPHYPWALFMRGRAYDRLPGLDDQGIADLTQAVTLSPRFVEAYFRRGDLHRKRRGHEAALKDYEKCLELNPNYLEAFHGRGHVHRTTGNLQGALADFTTVVQRAPEDPLGYRDRAELRLEQKQLEEALEDIDESIRLHPKYARSHELRGRIFEAMGREDQALEEYTSAMGLAEKDPDPAIRRGELKERRNDKEGAMADYSEAIRRNPEDSDGYERRLKLYRERGALDEAIGDSTMLVTLQPKSARHWATRGDLHRETGRLSEAIADYRKALEVAPQDWWGHKQLPKRIAELEKILQEGRTPGRPRE